MAVVVPQEVAEEEAIADAIATLRGALDERGLRQTDLADLLGVSPSRVSQIFGGREGLTVRLFARILNVLGKRPRFGHDDIEPKEEP